MRIYIIGYMGSGKSKGGQALATAMHYKFIDTDERAEAEEGKSITQIFHDDGEEYFRLLEHKILLKTADEKNVVVATGGGLPCFHDHMKWMNEQGITVYFEANQGLLFHRLALSEKSRPLLKGLGEVELMEQISRQLIERSPVYNLCRIKVQAASLNLKLLQEKIKKTGKIS